MSAPNAGSVRRFLLVHRRVWAAAFAGLAVVFALEALTPSAKGAAAVIVRHDLAAGSTLRAADLRVTKLPAEARPAHASTSVESLVGRRIAAPMRRGEAITDFRLLEPNLLEGYGKGKVLSTVPIADSTQLTGVRVGDYVNIIGADPQGEAETAVIARRAQIVSLPRGDEHGETTALTVVVDEDAGLRLATARLHAQLSILAVR